MMVSRRTFYETIEIEARTFTFHIIIISISCNRYIQRFTFSVYTLCFCINYTICFMVVRNHFFLLVMPCRKSNFTYVSKTAKTMNTCSKKLLFLLFLFLNYPRYSLEFFLIEKVEYFIKTRITLIKS